MPSEVRALRIDTASERRAARRRRQVGCRTDEDQLRLYRSTGRTLDVGQSPHQSTDASRRRRIAMTFLWATYSSGLSTRAGARRRLSTDDPPPLAGDGAVPERGFRGARGDPDGGGGVVSPFDEKTLKRVARITGGGDVLSRTVGGRIARGVRSSRPRDWVAAPADGSERSGVRTVHGAARRDPRRLDLPAPPRLTSGIPSARHERRCDGRPAGALVWVSDCF
jgi:hypothetical protein